MLQSWRFPKRVGGRKREKKREREIEREREKKRKERDEEASKNGKVLNVVLYNLQQHS